MEEADISSRFGISTKSPVRNASGGLNTSNKLLWITVIAGVALGFVAMVSLSHVIDNISKVQSYPDVCLEKDCLWAASEMLDNMNVSVNPCEDFYEFACGNFRNSHPSPKPYEQLTQFKLMQQRNEEKILELLKTDPRDPDADKSFENKLKLFYQSCQNEYQITSAGAKPVIDAMKPGWYALMTAPVNVTKNSLNVLLQRLHADYGVSPFFKFTVGLSRDAKTNPSDPDRNIIQVYFTKLEMTTDAYLGSQSYDYDYWWDSGSSAYYEALYKEYIINVVKLVQEDNGIQLSNPDQLAKTTADDVFYVESELAKIHDKYWTSSLYDAPENEKIRTVQWMQDNFNAPIQWKDLLAATFKDAGIRPETKIDLHLQKALKAILDFIAKLSDRELNNYLNWRLLSAYIDEMGWRFVHARRQFQQSYNTWNSNSENTEGRCLKQAKEHMRTAIDWLFTATHLGSGGKEKVDEINALVKQSLSERIDSISWMDKDTKKLAQNKLAKTVDMFGYPEWIVDRNAINQYYEKVTIVKDNHFKNVVSLRQFQLQKMSSDLLIVPDRTVWPLGVDTVSYAYAFSLNRMYYPAGLLQHPVFNYAVPQYINFATMGSTLASQLLSVFDDQGRKYDENGKYILNWWSNSTLKNFATQNVSDCNAQQFSELSSHIRKTTGTALLGEVAGLETAYKAYGKYQKYGSEKRLLGLQAETIRQQFFISYGQLYCYSGPQRDFFTGASRPIGSVMLNKVVQNSPDFAKSFKCKPTDKLATSSKCPGY